MPLSLIDILTERAAVEKKYFQNYLYFAGLIKREAKKILKETKVFVFGSILRKKEMPQDIDVLIISPELEMAGEKSRVRMELFRRLGFSHPFEIHLITPEEYKGWYSRFIKEKKEIK